MNYKQKIELRDALKVPSLNSFKKQKYYFCYIVLCVLPITGWAEEPQSYAGKVKKFASQLFVPKPKMNIAELNVEQLSKFSLDTNKVQDIPLEQAVQENKVVQIAGETTLYLNKAISLAVQRRPEITQSIASVKQQDSNIDVARAAYYPQISGGVSTGDLTKSNRGSQQYGISATQLIYDFGQVKNNVNLEKTKLYLAQAQVLKSIDDVALQTANSILNINHYRVMERIVEAQIKGLKGIENIANLRAKAGISSQADSIQALSYVEAAEANLIEQQNLLQQYEQKLKTYLGFDARRLKLDVPESLVLDSNLYEQVNYQIVPQLIEALTSVEIARLEKNQIQLSNYPTVNLKGSVSHTLNLPSESDIDRTSSALMFEVSMPIYEGGSRFSRAKAAGYSEEASKAGVDSVYLNITEQVQVLREQVDNTQRQISLLMQRKQTAMRTKELYQEQYKLGTRSIVDLLSAEQSIHSASQEIENARFKIYTAIVQYIYYTGQSRAVYKLNNEFIQGFKISP